MLNGRPYLIFCAILILGSTAAFAADPTNLFRKVILEANCNDPMELTVTPDGRVIFVERHGQVRIWKPDTKKTVLAANLPVHGNYNGSKEGSWEDGLLGIRLAPGFATNHWLYLYYSATNAPENRLSRFVLNGDVLDLASEKIILRVATQREICCHAAGSIAFDAQGNLFLSTGDNTNPFESDGYSPTDYRPRRYPFDAAKSAGNANDLRGKILRIHPEPDGSYSIPEGNLFSKGTPKTRPEIYIMGCRNPFRISIDQRTGTLYWGEVGPDAREINPQRGPAGFDEINRATKAGNYGWPFIIADNKPYRAYDFATKTTGAAFDPKAPRNSSPNNTGPQELPPAQPAWIWYPYSPSSRFPQLGSGGRTACAGPIYYFDPQLRSGRKLPAEYDHTLFIYEWVRNWIMAVKLDANGEMVSIKPFASDIKLKRPAEMELGPDGALYVIEFGTNWEKNKDSQIVRIEAAAATPD
jgi:cytochrome c